MKKLSALFAGLCFSVGVFAAAAEQVMVVDPYIRLAPSNAPATAAFMVLHNHGSKDIKLVKAENPASRLTELHTHLNENGVMKMRQIAAIEIKAKGEVALQPSGLHVMMIDLKAPLKNGELVPLTLIFDDGSSKTVEARVKPIMPSGHMHHQH